MPIDFACACGKRFRVLDSHAGKRAKCPACGANLLVPTPPPEIDEEPEIIDDEPEVVDDEPEIAIEVVEDDVVEDVEVVNDDPPAGKKKKKKKRKQPEESGPLASMYMEQARREMERDEARARGTGRGEEAEGWTMFGIHLTAGVVSGLGLIFSGVVALIVIALANDPREVEPKTWIAAVGCTGVGLLTLAKVLLFGEED